MRDLIKRTLGDSLVRNSILIMATTLSTSAVGYAYWIIAARFLPPSSVGLASSLVSVATVVSMIGNLGAGHTFIQYLGRSTVAAWSRTFSTGLIAGIAGTVIAALATVLVLPQYAHNFAILREPFYAVLVVAASVALTVSTLLDYVFIAERASRGMLSRNAALAVGKTVLLVAFFALGARSSGAVLLSWAAVLGVISLVTLERMIHPLRPGVRVTLAGMGAELRRTRNALAGHHLLNLLQAVPTLLLPVMVMTRLGSHASGQFYLTWMLGSVLFMVSPSISSALFAEGANRTGGIPALVRRAVLMTGAILAVPVLILSFFGGPVLSLFGPGYARAGAPLLLLIVLSLAPEAANNIAVAVWRSQERLGRCLAQQAVMAATCLTGTWFLLPGYGILAPGLGWVACQVAGMAMIPTLLLLPGRRRPPAPRHVMRSKDVQNADPAPHEPVRTGDRRPRARGGDAGRGVHGSWPRGDRADLGHVRRAG